MIQKTLLDYQNHWEEICNKGFINYLSLSSDERIWLNIQGFIGQVNNGGVISFYYNIGADWNNETIEDLISIGASEVANIIIECNKLFSTKTFNLNHQQRNNIIESWDENKDNNYNLIFDDFDIKFGNLVEDLERKLVTHIESNLIKT